MDCNAVKFCNVVLPVARMLAAVKSELTNEFVVVNLVANRSVEVELVEVEFLAVKFCKVDEPVTCN